MSPTHSPAPWSVNDPYLVDAEHIELAIISGGNDADVLVMKAAPELLDALLDLYRVQASSDDADTWNKRFRGAMEKARAVFAKVGVQP